MHVNVATGKLGFLSALQGQTSLNLDNVTWSIRSSWSHIKDNCLELCVCLMFQITEVLFCLLFCFLMVTPVAVVSGEKWYQNVF